MLDRARLPEAISIQQATFGLLKWVRTAINKGVIKLETAHRYMSEAEAAADWVAEHYANLPRDCRPASRQGKALERFASFFASYLLTSYELVERPTQALRSACGCYCPICTHVTYASYLQPRKIRQREKRKAEKLKRTYLEDLSARARIAAPAEVARILANRALSERAALGAYAVQLIRRCDGFAAGPEVLALWREFAWTPSGSPKRNYRLTPEAVATAEARLLEELARPGRGARA